MNAEAESMRGKQRQVIQQTTMMLPYFDEEVPALFLADGTAYLPVFKPVYTRAGGELTDPQEGCKLKDIQIKTSGEQPCLGVRQ